MIRSGTGLGMHCCACTHPTGKYKFRLRMRTSNGKKKLPVGHAYFEKNLHFPPVRGCLKPYAFDSREVCNTSRPSRFRLVSTSLSNHLNSTVAHAANFTHSFGISLIRYLLHNFLFFNYFWPIHTSISWSIYTRIDQLLIKIIRGSNGSEYFTVSNRNCGQCRVGMWS